MALPVLATLAGYLSFAEPDLRLVYGLLATGAAVGLAMALLRGLAKIRDGIRVQKSSWRTFDKIARVRGLSRLEIRLLTTILRRARVKRPSQVLGSIKLYDRLVDEALDRKWIAVDDQSHLEAARTKLVRSSRKWDGHTNHRQFERAPCSFDVSTLCITKEMLDEELKISYQEADEKFRQALRDLIAQGRPESTRIIDLSAGGLSLLAQDKDQFHSGDYVAFTEGGDPLPFDLTAIHGRVEDVERMEDQRQLVLHVSFLPYASEVRKQVIQTVYAAAEQTAPGRQAQRTGDVPKKGEGGRKGSAGKGTAAKQPGPQAPEARPADPKAPPGKATSTTAVEAPAARAAGDD